MIDLCKYKLTFLVPKIYYYVGHRLLSELSKTMDVYKFLVNGSDYSCSSSHKLPQASPFILGPSVLLSSF